MMDAIYFEKPILLVIPIVLLIWQAVSHFIFKKSGTKTLTHILSGVNAALHAIGLSIIMISGGTLEDALVLVLASGLLTIALCPVPASETEETNK